MTSKQISMMAVIALAGCGSDDGTELTGDGVTDGPLYAVQYAVPNVSDGYDAYVGFVPSLEPQQVDPSRSLEVTGGGFLSGTPLLPSTFFVASAEAPTVTRYEVSADGSFVRGPTVSFAAQGLAWAPRFQANMIYASTTKAFAFSFSTQQVIIWNPTAMEVVRAIPLEGLTREGFENYDASASIVRDNVAYIPSYFGNIETSTAGSESVVVAINLSTDEVTVQTVTNCGGLRSAFITVSGDIVVSGSAGNHGVLHRLHGNVATTPCVLRLAPGQSDFSRAERFDASSLAGGRLVVDVTSAGNNLVFQALDESLIAIGPETTRGDLIGATAWPWAYAPLDALGSNSPYTPIPEMTVGQVASLRAIVEGHTFVQVTDADARSRLFDVTDPALPVESISANGFIDAVFRLR